MEEKTRKVYQPKKGNITEKRRYWQACIGRVGAHWTGGGFMLFALPSVALYPCCWAWSTLESHSLLILNPKHEGLPRRSEPSTPYLLSFINRCIMFTTNKYVH